MHILSVGPVPAPLGSMGCSPEIKKATASEFELLSRSKPSNFLIGEIVAGGQVSFIVENLPKDGTGCPGKWMFDQMMGHFGSSVTGVQGFWTGPLSDNLKVVNTLTATGMPLEAAAKQTWTGKRATKWGYPSASIGYNRIGWELHQGPCSF